MLQDFVDTKHYKVNKDPDLSQKLTSNFTSSCNPENPPPQRLIHKNKGTHLLKLFL